MVALMAALGAASAARQSKLEASLRLQQFLRDGELLEGWIAKRLSQATETTTSTTEAGLQAQQKKHGAFEAEVAAHTNTLDKLQAAAAALQAEKHYAVAEVTAKMAAVEEHWRSLVDKTKVKTKVLTDAYTLMLFKRETAELASWVGDKAAVARSTDVGADLEHCDAQLKKFEDFSNDVAANKPRLETLAAKAEQLTGEGHPASEAIRALQGGTAGAWAELQQLTAARGQALSDAREIHSFTREVEEATARVQEKTDVLEAGYEAPRNLPAVEALQRLHDAFERDLAALQESVTALEGEAARLTAKCAALVLRMLFVL